MSAWEITNVTAQLLLPPGVLILLIVVGLAFVPVRPRYGAALALVGTLSLYILSMPIVGWALMQSIDVPFVDPAADRSGGAIVVLGAGSYVRAPEYGGDTVSRFGLERIRYAAYLHNRTGKPVLVAGGNPAGAATSEARQMQAALREFGVSAQWVEDQSTNTFENARYTQQKLRQSGVEKIYLVTHAWHMPRARMAFEESGLEVIPAPLGYNTRLDLKPLDFVPNAAALQKSWLFFHETAGLAWYRLKFASGR